MKRFLCILTILPALLFVCLLGCGSMRMLVDATTPIWKGVTLFGIISVALMLTYQISRMILDDLTLLQSGGSQRRVSPNGDKMSDRVPNHHPNQN